MLTLRWAKQRTRCARCWASQRRWVRVEGETLRVCQLCGRRYRWVSSTLYCATYPVDDGPGRFIDMTGRWVGDRGRLN